MIESPCCQLFFHLLWVKLKVDCLCHGLSWYWTCRLRLWKDFVILSLLRFVEVPNWVVSVLDMENPTRSQQIAFQEAIYIKSVVQDGIFWKQHKVQARELKYKSQNFETCTLCLGLVPYLFVWQQPGKKRKNIRKNHILSYKS